MKGGWAVSSRTTRLWQHGASNAAAMLADLLTRGRAYAYVFVVLQAFCRGVMCLASDSFKSKSPYFRFPLCKGMSLALC